MKIVAATKKPINKNQSKTYIKYERLLSDIEQKQLYTSNIREGLRKAQIKINEELSPLQMEGHMLSRDHIIRLDELSTEIGVGKYNGEWFEEYINEELDSLLDFFGHQDQVLSDLYKKYAGVTIEDIAADDDIIETVDSLSDLFGFKVDIKEFLEKGEKAYFDYYRDHILSNFKDKSGYFDNSELETEKADKRKNKNDELAEEDIHLAKDARDIYMRLVKKFHPDLEKDALIKDQKTEIIKQVTKAYQENDFFNLLKLQITYLEDNEKDAEVIADDMLKRYNKILQKQLDEINMQLQAMHFASEDIIEDFIDKNGKFSAQKFAARKRALEKENAKLKASITDSKKRPKGWFKDQIGIIKGHVQQNMMRNMFAEMFNSVNVR